MSLLKLFNSQMIAAEDWYSAPRANIYGAFAAGFYVIVAAPTISQLLTAGRAAEKRLWIRLGIVTGMFVVVGFGLDWVGPLRGWFHFFRAHP
jgi:hypothetical protein